MKKWYLDLVTREGLALIAYAAELQVMGIRFQRGALLLPNGEAPLLERRASLRDAWPTLGARDIRWNCPALGLHGAWQGVGEPMTAKLINEPGCTIRWRCHGIALPAVVEVAGEGRWDGLGYAETLELESRSLSLPFRTLHWGRFQGESGTRTAWIQWDRREKHRWVWHQSRLVSADLIDVSGWSAPEGRLELPPGRVLRSEWVAQEVFGTSLARVIPGLWRARDEKRLSRGTWHTEDKQEMGWAIHERVTWG